MESFRINFQEALKHRFIVALIDFIVISFMVPFITYDTGVRCITDPCTESAARGSLLEFLAKSHELTAYIVDYWIFAVAFVLLWALIEYIEKVINVHHH